MVVKPTASDLKEAAREATKELYEEALLSVKEVAGILGMSAYTIRRWVQTGRLEAIHISSRCLRFRRVDVRAFIEALKKRSETLSSRKKGRRKVSEQDDD